MTKKRTVGYVTLTALAEALGMPNGTVYRMLAQMPGRLNLKRELDGRLVKHVPRVAALKLLNAQPLTAIEGVIIVPEEKTGGSRIDELLASIEDSAAGIREEMKREG